MGQHAGLRQCWCQQNSLSMSAVWQKELSALEGHGVGGGCVSPDVGGGCVSPDVGGGCLSPDVGGGCLSHDVGGGCVSPMLVTSAGPLQGHENSPPKTG